MGDQILIVEGESLLNVNHDDAAQAIKNAMSQTSKTLHIIVAQIQGTYVCLLYYMCVYVYILYTIFPVH